MRHLSFWSSRDTNSSGNQVERLEIQSAPAMSTKPAPSAPGPEAGSVISRTFLVPILFVSFLVSLFFVDKKTSAGVFASNDRTDSQHKHEHYYHSHQRQLAKKELDDAFVLRKRVIAAMPDPFPVANGRASPYERKASLS